MHDDPLPMRTFLTVFGKWLQAIEFNRLDDATFFADELHAVGQMLAVDPEFHRVFRAGQLHCTHGQPGFALDCLHAFLRAITEAAHVERRRQDGSTET